MKKSLVLFICIVSLNWAWSHQVIEDNHEKLIPIPAYFASPNGASAQSSLEALGRFLDKFDEDLKHTFIFDLNAPQRSAWSNLPARFVDRHGLAISEMDDEQRQLLFRFLSASLGKTGYKKIADVMAAEAFLNSDPRATFMKWNPENYWFAIYGNPAENSEWGWQFGGHHLALNISVKENVTISMSPSFIGTEPAIFTYDDNQYQAIVTMNDAGLKLYESLDATQKLKAGLYSVPNDVVTGPGRDGVIPPQAGVAGSQMTPDQRALLLNAISEWVSIQADEPASTTMQQIVQQLDQVTFAWVGSGEVNSDTYFRIQGPNLIIELLSTEANVGDSAKGLGHFHTIYRNPMLEYGQKPRR